MANPADILFGEPDVAQVLQAPVTDTFRWATVVGFNPLTIRFDGESTPLAIEPVTLVDPHSMTSGSRVWVQIHGHRVIILGASRGGQYESGNLADIATINSPDWSWNNTGTWIRSGSTLWINGAFICNVGSNKPADGNIGNMTAATLFPEFAPVLSCAMGSAATGQMVNWIVTTNGAIQATATVPNGIPAGGAVGVYGSLLLAGG